MCLEQWQRVAPPGARAHTCWHWQLQLKVDGVVEEVFKLYGFGGGGVLFFATICLGGWCLVCVFKGLFSASESLWISSFTY